ncbi:MAG: hypothetical protein QXL10_03180 [Candidatus Bathyarchaeia archaeon]
MLVSETIIEGTVIPIGDRPRNSPEMPTMLKLSATDNTAFSTKSNLPSWNMTLTRQ